MSIFDKKWQISGLRGLKNGLWARSLHTKLILWLIPPVMIILMITGYLSYRVSYQFINTALERTVKLQTRAIAHDIEQFFEQCKQDLLFIAQNQTDFDQIGSFLAKNRMAGGIEYQMVAFFAQKNAAHHVVVADEEGFAPVSSIEIAQIEPNPMLLLGSLASLKPGSVWISPITELEVPLASPDQPNRRVSFHVIEFATPHVGDDGRIDGFFVLTVDIVKIRNILSVFNSPQSPIWSYPRTPEVRYSFLVDQEGWILFQSEGPEKENAPLSTYLARSGLEGTLGKPGLPGAFRPASHYGYFWKMVNDIRSGVFGLIKPKDYGDIHIGHKEHYLAYSPVYFKTAQETPPAVYAGVAYVDISRLTLAAGYKQVDVMFIITLASAVLVALLIFLLGRAITRPLLQLVHAVEHRQETGHLEPISLPCRGYEVNALQTAINGLIQTVSTQLDQIRQKDRAIHAATLKEAVWVPEETQGHDLIQTCPEIPQIVGSGTKIDSLKNEILKAARVDVDVLILGETGTGKQLAAEAIHDLSGRSERPFISINCGALDENLLLDTLFGHTRGAFTEARTDRKGAFLEAHGGTLFLDEIQAASARVQQSMLRVLAVRKIKPLGSDRETDVDVRIIAASNADLKTLITANRFREDLYYRLKVLTIHTPPLREHMEDVPLLARHFLQAQGRAKGLKVLGLSRGALEKMKQYEWPGNVRELENCIIQAAVMAESRIIQAEDLFIDASADQNPSQEALAPDVRPGPGQGTPEDFDRSGPDLNFNPRQQKAMPGIRERTSITRSEYQKLAGERISARTAVYDLKDLVEKGVLYKVGKGPATRYCWQPAKPDPSGETE